MSHTRDDVELLKTQWRADPCWDIEGTEGFEEHEEELLAYRLEMEARWDKERKAKLQAKANELECSLPLAEYILTLEYRLDEMNQALERVYFSSHSH